MAVPLVEDKEAAREMSANRLCEIVYELSEASDGPAALDLLAAAVRIDLFVTDVDLPNGPNGRPVANAARERRPDLPVSFITGHALEKQLAPGVQGSVGKPFMLEASATQAGALGKSVDPALS